MHVTSRPCPNLWDALKVEAWRRADDPERLAGVTALGVDEHVWRPGSVCQSTPRRRASAFTVVSSSASAPGMAADTSSVCGTSTERAAWEAGAQIGGGVAIAMMFGLWLFVDLLVGVIYGVYRSAKRT